MFWTPIPYMRFDLFPLHSVMLKAANRSVSTIIAPILSRLATRGHEFRSPRLRLDHLRSPSHYTSIYLGILSFDCSELFVPNLSGSIGIPLHRHSAPHFIGFNLFDRVQAHLRDLIPTSQAFVISTLTDPLPCGFD